jgi:alkylhydroperoxidase family enzyme
VAPLLAGTASDATPLEQALLPLIRRAHEAPTRLSPADLAPLRHVAGDGALDYLLVLCTFHFINRIADLLAVPPEALPLALRRFEPLRRLAVRMASVLLRRMDLAPRPETGTFAGARGRLEEALGRPVGDAVEPLRERPKVIESIALAVEERERRSSLDRATLARVQRAVDAALPRSAGDATGFHQRPSDPVDAFAFVGTRYANRTTAAQIAALRGEGYDDLGILDLVIAVADANQWARLLRLAGLPAELCALVAANAPVAPRHGGFRLRGGGRNPSFARRAPPPPSGLRFLPLMGASSTSRTNMYRKQLEAFQVSSGSTTQHPRIRSPTDGAEHEERTAGRPRDGREACDATTDRAHGAASGDSAAR